MHLSLFLLAQVNNVTFVIKERCQIILQVMELFK